MTVAQVAQVIGELHLSPAWKTGSNDGGTACVVVADDWPLNVTSVEIDAGRCSRSR